MVKQLKELCIELDIIMLVIHHINKPEKGRRKRKLEKEDLKGSSDVYQIAEVVILMYPGKDSHTIIDIDKNKGPQGRRHCLVDMRTGRFSSPSDITNEDMETLEREAEESWNSIA